MEQRTWDKDVKMERLKGYKGAKVER